jgi:hypothetical protein
MERVRIGFNRYRPYAKRVGEFLKDVPKRAGEIAKYSTSKVSSISDTIDNAINSPLGDLIKENILPDGLKTDLEQFSTLNKFVGNMAKSGNMMLNGDIITGFNKGYGAVRDVQKQLNDTDQARRKKDKKRIEEKNIRIEKRLNERKNKGDTNFAIIPKRK